VPDELAQLIDELGGLGVGVGRVGAGALDGDLDVVALVDGIAVEHGAEGLELAAQRGRIRGVLLQQLAHEGDDGRGVEAARETRADGDLGDEPPLDAGAEEAAEQGRVGAPVAAQLGRPVGRARERSGEQAGLGAGGGGCARRRRRRAEGDLHPGGRRHVIDTGEHRLGAVVVQAVLEELVHHLIVGRRLEVAVLQQRLDLAGEEQPARLRRARIEQGLDTEVVAVEDELALALTKVGDGERPHAVEACRAARAPFLIRVDDDLAVAAGAKDVPGGHKLGVQLAVVVDLAVVHQPDRLVFVGDGLVTAFAIDDAEAAVTEADGGPLERAGVVGTAMHEGGGHAAEELAVR
jgi:hypothetical protein